jgi:hypothetical protein
MASVWKKNLVAFQAAVAGRVFLEPEAAVVAAVLVKRPGPSQEGSWDPEMPEDLEECSS